MEDISLAKTMKNQEKLIWQCTKCIRKTI